MIHSYGTFTRVTVLMSLQLETEMFWYRFEQVGNTAMILLEIYTPRTGKGDYISVKYRLKTAIRILYKHVNLLIYRNY